MTATDALVAFVLDRLDEEERDARAAMGIGRWEVRQEHHVYETDAPPSWNSVASHAIGYAAHIARQDPRATLARVAALRTLVETCAPIVDHGLNDDVLMATAALEGLAAIWSWHEDYDESWTP